MKRHRQIGRAQDCAACGEPSTLIENVGSALVCTPCVARLRAHVAAKRARERAPSAAIRDAFRNADRRKLRPTLA